MRSLLLASLLVACGPAPAIAPPHAPSCPTLEQGIIGTWTRNVSVMEIRPDGSILRDSVEGAFRWTAPGHATIDIRGSHEEHTIGLMTIGLLLDVDTNDRARTWSRVTPAPPTPDGCFDVRGSLIGAWSDGAVTESFAADGRYARGDERGAWQLVEPGLLQIGLEGGLSARYRIALASPTLLVSALEDPDAGASARGPSLVESRVR